MNRVCLISDTHFFHDKIAEYCGRPKNHTELMAGNWNRLVKDDDLVIHLGDVQIGNKENWIINQLPGRKVLIRGNHDRDHSCAWWMDHGFDFACDGMLFRNWWLSHEPAQGLPQGADLGNIHGHLHNIWENAAPNAGLEIDAPTLGHLKNDWQRLFAIEYTNYAPVEFDKFISSPDKYQARWPTKKC